MRYINLGDSGLRVSRIALGMFSFGAVDERPWTLDETHARPIIHRAIELGINCFDTADIYNRGESEIITGKVLSEALSREEYVVATKVYEPTMSGENGHGLSRKHILASIDESLRRLQLEYVDLYQIHRWDENTPIEETMEALHDIVKSGKARYIGASSMYAWQFAKAQTVAERYGWTRFISMQNHYNLIYREEEREMIPLCCDQGIGVMPYSPLARGILTGAARDTIRAKTDDIPDEIYPNIGRDIPVIDAIASLAHQRGVSRAEVALAWLLHKRGVTAPIVGATRVAHVDDAVEAVALELTADEIADLELTYEPHAVSGH